MFYLVDFLRTSHLSDYSEGLLGRDKGGAGIYNGLCNEDQDITMKSKRWLLGKKSDISKNLMLYGKNQESVLTEIIPRICTLATQGQHPVLSQDALFWVPSGTRLEWPQWRSTCHCFVSIFRSLRAHCPGGFMVAASFVYWSGREPFILLSSNKSPLTYAMA